MSLIAFVGSYADVPAHGPGGIDVLALSAGGEMSTVSRIDEPDLAGYLVYAAGTRTLYAVNEQKNDGRGPVRDPAAVHAFRFDPDAGTLTSLGRQVSPGPRPTFLSVDEGGSRLVSANHGDFDHVEHVVRTADGGWDIEHLYDDGTVVLYDLAPDGAIADIRDLVISSGTHGTDPNRYLQAGGHGQASPHPHCAVIDPSGRWVVVCDKGTDAVTVYALGDRLIPTTVLQLPPETGPRHVVFDEAGTRAYMTYEFASEVASFAFDPQTGILTPIDAQSTLPPGFTDPNEPADVRLHPSGRFVYVNNRGEDTLAWFAADESGCLERRGSVPLAPSLHPGLAARSFAFDPTGAILLVADRPANLVRSYAVDPRTGALAVRATFPIADPAFVTVIDAGEPGNPATAGS